MAAIATIIHAKIAAILAYFSAVWAGEATPGWPHAILLFISIGGAAVCAVGIVFEAEKRKSHPLHRIAEKLVIWGVVIEALCTISLFVFDERISNAQESKIVELEQLTARAIKTAGEADERASGLNLQAQKLREQLVAQGPREALLRGAIRKTLVDSLKPFAGQKIDVRFSAARSWGASGNWEIVAIGDDVLGLSQTFIGIVKGANWKSPDKPLVSEFRGNGLRVEVLQKASQRTMKAASALAEALRKVPLAVEGPVRVRPEQAKRVPMDKALPEFGDGTVILTVLTHP
ncbi:MAG TPA: hypothetical protein VN692_04800 [Steroidobacteraceae bacterium]|nr:hypothetical protein [Steroidobacteraceae bacterium]